jgi:hypothetical protein
MKIKHGKANTRLFGLWRGILTRCNNPNRSDYKYYGGRGITVCDEWLHDFQAFYDWAMANGYEEHLTIDRIDVNGNYCPENCRWVTMQKQSENKSNRRIILAFGETLSLTQWANRTGISKSTIKSRIEKLGWSNEKALTHKPNYKARKDQ